LRGRATTILSTETEKALHLCVKMEKMKLEVNCYSGRTADERPVRFRLEDCQYMVEEVLDQWYGPQDAFYKVRADDGNLYILRRETSTPDGLWHLESFRQLPRQS
jgi:hypothetical protein